MDRYGVNARLNFSELSLEQAAISIARARIACARDNTVAATVYIEAAIMQLLESKNMLSM